MDMKNRTMPRRYAHQAIISILAAQEMMDGIATSQPGAGKRFRLQQSRPRIKTGIGRNQPCPCGSGKKYKNCHINGDGIQKEITGDNLQ